MKHIVCDFDGTIISKNSFPLWIIFIIKKSILQGNFGVLFHFIAALIVRKLRIIDHAQFKCILMRKRYPKKYDIEFIFTLKKHLNLELISRIQETGEGIEKTLSSAAPEKYLLYANEILDIEFNNIIGSSLNGGELFENYGNNKVYSLNKKGIENNEIIFFTDHHEDIPLMRNSNKVFLVNPSSATLENVNRAGIDYQTIN